MAFIEFLWRRPLTALLAVALAACGNVPLLQSAPLPATPAPSSYPAPAPLPAPVVAPEPPPPPAASEPAPPPPQLESPGVAARFPEPAVTYRTPAFAPGHDAITSNTELHDAMRALVYDGGAKEGALTIKLLPLGSSQTGAPLEALFFTRDADAAMALPMRTPRPTVLLVGQQHGDEPAGSEALLVIAQELAQGKLQAVLDRINVIILPRANPDGAAAGRRGTASGIDANRDHLLLRTPEAQAQAQLVREFAPVVVVDAHEYTAIGRYVQKFGAVQRYDALVQYAMTANLPEFVTKASEEWFRKPMLARFKTEGIASQWYYTTSSDVEDKKISMGGVQPDTGRNVNGLTNAVSILIETRGGGIGRLHFKRRVYTHVTAIGSVLNSAAQRSADLVKLRQFVDNDVAAKACQGEVIVEAEATNSEYSLTMLDPTTGADKTVSVSWDSALALNPLKRRARPCGYWLGADQTDAVMRLRALGVQVRRADEPGSLRGETYRETSRATGVRSDVLGSIADAGGVVLVKVDLVPALIDVPAGSFYVPLDQPLANLVLAAMEPDTQNSFFANRIVTGIELQARVLQRPEVRMTTLP